MMRDFVNVHHRSVVDHALLDAVDDKHRLLVKLSLFQQADDAVGIPDGRNLRRRDHNRLVSAGDGIGKALLDARRTVNQNIVIVRLQLIDNCLDLIRFNCRLVRILCRRKQEKPVLEALVLDYGLVKLAPALYNVDNIVDDPVVESQDNIKIAQSDVKVKHDDLSSHESQGRTKIRGRRRLADATLAGRNHNRSSHQIIPPFCVNIFGLITLSSVTSATSSA